MTSRLPDPTGPAFEFDEPTGPAAQRPSRRRRYTLIGLSAGLLGGAAVGFAATSPLSSQAAGLPTLSVAPDTSVASDDDTGAGAATAAPEATGRGEWVRELLQPLVADGTLTSEQLDAVVATLEDAGPTMPGHAGRGERGAGHGARHLRLDREELAAVLGIDTDTLADQLRAGTSLAEIANEHGVDVDTVIDLLVADVEARLDARVTDGTLTEEQAAERAAEVRERVTALVNGERGVFGDGAGPGGRGRGGFPGGPGRNADDAAEHDDDAVDEVAPDTTVPADEG